MTSPSVLQSQSCHSLADWLCYIEQSHPIEKIELGLGRVLQVASRGALQQLPDRVILIAGTNGKGTTARTLEQLLLAQGYSVGVYSSPHLLKFNERLRLNGTDVSDELWVEGLRQVEALRQDVALTYFEFTTLAAFAILKQQEPDFCLIEVGLGGRLDATNIVEPELSIVTTVDLDHQDWLGNDRETIGREKAGVFRPGRHAVVGDLQMPQSVAEVAADLGARLTCAGHDYHVESDGQQFDWHFGASQLLALPAPAVPVQNVATALTTLALLDVLPAEAVIRTVLQELTLAGRMQWLSRQPAILLDVAHNPQSARYLASALAQLAGQYTQIHLVVGMLKDKDIREALVAFCGNSWRWHLVSLPGVRGAGSDLLQQALPATEQSCQYRQLSDVYSCIEAASADELFVVFGSFVTVSAMLSLWPQENV
ncbi:bifunctional tetrahydrofolate synthase/dihydrofolate synthase [Rheinheimera sp. F8]|uniref:bifunctional tetrahydrofolate synthase/dihydrofolate synthase n=1 Tax=Rheinheimera sp. F8 TaxID=1763998 RepID=UPI000744D6DE|nr:bifunctional tetrahydrofolate synthase/dihydrofolate synthase [Rheinheimera sp. F8]ALZ74477.1 bifunctional folylpolyglutamate synthase/dihydrofolate synthase [Rheinheimera sp. F8]